MKRIIRRALKYLNPEIRGLGNLTYGMWSITFFIAAVSFFALMLSLVAALTHSKSLPAEPRLIPTASSIQTLLSAYIQASAFLLKNDISLVIMSAILLAGVLSLLYGVYRTYRGFSYLSRYVPYTGLGKAGAVLYLLPPLIPVGEHTVGDLAFLCRVQVRKCQAEGRRDYDCHPVPAPGARHRDADWTPALDSIYLALGDYHRAKYSVQ